MFTRLNFSRLRESLHPSIRDAITRSPDSYIGDPEWAAEEAESAAQVLEQIGEDFKVLADKVRDDAKIFREISAGRVDEDVIV